MVKPDQELPEATIEKAIDLVSQSRQTLQPGMATHSDALFAEPQKPIQFLQSHHLLDDLFTTLELKRGSTFELTFKLVMFYNSMPGVPGTA